jgi:hypothetical protein
VYSVDADGAYFVRMEFEAHNKGISCLVMLSEGTLLSGGERDRKIAAWDTLQNYKKITDIKVGKDENRSHEASNFSHQFLAIQRLEFEPSTTLWPFT